MCPKRRKRRLMNTSGIAMADNRCRFQSGGVREKARAGKLLLVNREKGLL
jgi:hypothetical protein